MQFEEEYWTDEDKESFFYEASVYFANQIIENVICVLEKAPWQDTSLVLKDIYPALNGNNNEVPDWSQDQEIEITDLKSLFKAAYFDAREQDLEATVIAVPYNQLAFDTANGVLEIADVFWLTFEQVAAQTFIDHNQILVDSESLLKLLGDEVLK